MEIKFTVIKEERKALVAAVSEITGWAAVYKGAPSFSYSVNNYTIDKTGMLIYDGRTDSEDVRRLLARLAERGFYFEGSIDEFASVEVASDAALTVADAVEENGNPDRLAVEVWAETSYPACTLKMGMLLPLADVITAVGSARFLPARGRQTAGTARYCGV